MTVALASHKETGVWSDNTTKLRAISNVAVHVNTAVKCDGVMFFEVFTVWCHNLTADMTRSYYAQMLSLFLPLNNTSS
jgi:hypothetical protein